MSVHPVEQQLRDEIDRIRSERDRLLDTLNDAFLLVDSAELIRFANTAARSLFAGRELTGRRITEIVADVRFTETLARCFTSGKPVVAQIVLPQQTSLRGDSENRGLNAWVVDAAPVSGEGETLTRVVIRDVTSEHQLEQVRKDFVANASHELRTPLAIISGYLENLLDDNLIGETEVAHRFLRIMRKHTERISRIVEDMLVISKLESGEAGALKIAPFKLQSCIHDVTERLEAMIQERKAEIFLRLPEGPVVLEGDRFYWTQVIFNLVENALKQNPFPGLRVEVGCDANSDPLRIWVSDNGVGIPSVDLPHIFRRFYRVEKHHSQQEIKGTGLGLSIVKRAIEAHHGTISVTSIPGRETRFLMIVPRTQPEAS